MAERGSVGARPHAAAIRDHRDHAARWRQHAPHLAQQAFRVVTHLQRMHQEDAIDRGIRQRQREFIDQRRQRRPPGRPFQDALRRRHESEAALRILAEQPEVGRRIADAEHALAFGPWPAGLDAAIDQPPRHDTEALRVKIAEINDVHGPNLTCGRSVGRAQNGIAAAALTPYLSWRLWGWSHHAPGWRTSILFVEISWLRKFACSPASPTISAI